MASSGRMNLLTNGCWGVTVMLCLSLHRDTGWPPCSRLEWKSRGQPSVTNSSLPCLWSPNKGAAVSRPFVSKGLGPFKVLTLRLERSNL